MTTEPVAPPEDATVAVPIDVIRVVVAAKPFARRLRVDHHHRLHHPERAVAPPMLRHSH